MFDAQLRPLIDPALNRIGRALAALGISANGVTLGGMLVGLLGAFAAAHNQMGLALMLIIANRLLDGLDGAVARATRLTDFGGYLDIVADFVFYTAIPLGFAFAAPQNQLPTAVLLASFALTGTSFLAYATMAAKRGMETSAHGRKSFFYNTGLAEGTETIATFILICLWPSQFGLIAFVYAGLCGLTVIQRTLNAWHEFG